MRVLQLCPKPPRPSHDGGCLAMDALTRGLLADGHRVRLLVACTTKHPHLPEYLDPFYTAATQYQAVTIDTAINPIDAFSHLITGESYHIGRFHAPDLERILEDILRRELFDIILLESLFTAAYVKSIRRLSDAKIILRAHNVEHRIWQGLVEESKPGLKKWYLSKLTKQLAEYESVRINDFDAIVPITAEDAAIFREVGATVPIHVAPFGMDFKEEEGEETFGLPIFPASVDHVFHFGSMDWQPNVQGVDWLINEVWPIVRNSNSDAKLILAGRNMPDQFISDADNGIDVVGEIEDAEEFFQRNGIMTVPIHSGSGMRVKAIEGISAGRPTVSTEIGVCGIGLVNKKHALIANDAEEFANHILYLLSNPIKANEMAEEGREYVRSKFGNNIIVKSLVEFLHTID